MSLSTGDIIDGKYRIVRLIGEGGMGAVYEGENTRIHRRVAIKVLHANLAQTGEAVARFEREAQAAGRIGSEHIVEVLDLGNLPNGDRYMVMEFMDGDSLSGRIRARGRLAPAEIQPIMSQLLEALAAAHGAGIIHRDLKPDNVYLLRSRAGKADFVKLLDFGISKFNQLSGDSAMSMTRTGSVMGTPYYMAPEQAKGARNLDQRVDLYSAGVILYEAVTGEVPFNADTFNELLFKIVLETARPVEAVVPGIDPGFAAIVGKSMARDPNLRFQTAAEFQQALEQWARGAGLQVPATAHSAAHAPSLGGGAPGAPAQVSAAYAAAGSGAYPVPGAGTLGSTPGTWSQTGGAVAATPPPKKSHAGLVAALAVLALVLVGGGGYAALSLSHESAAAAAAGKAEADKAQGEKAKAEQAEKAAREQASQAEAEAQKAKAEAEAEKAKAEKAKAEADAATAAAASAALAAKPTPPAPLAVRPAARPAAAKPDKPEPPAATPAPTPAATGRRLRTSL
jgi:tRNA A-37 threonylcarbamoyl transferase component Bud32